MNFFGVVTAGLRNSFRPLRQNRRRDRVTRPESRLENRLKQAPIRSGYKARAPLEDSAKEGCIFLADRRTDFIRGGTAAFQQSLCFFDTQVLHIVDEDVAGGSLEATFQRARGNPGIVDNPLNNSTVAKMLAQPGLACPDHGVDVQLVAQQSGIRQLTSSRYSWLRVPAEPWGRMHDRIATRRIRFEEFETQPCRVLIPCSRRCPGAPTPRAQRANPRPWLPTGGGPCPRWQTSGRPTHPKAKNADYRGRCG